MTSAVKLHVEFDRETDGRWIAEAIDLPGVMAYGASEEEALARVEDLALRVIADRIESGESEPAATPVMVWYRR